MSLHTLAPEAIESTDWSHIVDVRSRDEFARGHIPQSINIPLEELPQALPRLQQLPKVILSCQSGNRAQQAYTQLSAQNVRPLYVLAGGLHGWRGAKRPVQSWQRGISLMRQVQIVAGAMILAGYFIPTLSVLPLIVGAGLLVAGLTNTCLMAQVLSKMPWNHASAVANCSLTEATPSRVTVADESHA